MGQLMTGERQFEGLLANQTGKRDGISDFINESLRVDITLNEKVS